MTTTETQKTTESVEIPEDFPPYRNIADRGIQWFFFTRLCEDMKVDYKHLKYSESHKALVTALKRK